MATMDYSRHSPFNEREGAYLDSQYDPDELTSGEGVINRDSIGSNALPITSQQIRWSYFTARKSETVTKVLTVTGTTAAAATPTLCRVGVYEVEDNGDLTLIASTANNTSLWAATFTVYTTDLQVPFEKVAGTRYAVGVIIVTAAATPTFQGGSTSISSVVTGLPPKLCGLLGSQADLLSTVPAASVSDSGIRIYSALVP